MPRLSKRQAGTISLDDTIEWVDPRPRAYRKRDEELTERMRQSHRLDELIRRYGPISAKDLIDKSGYTERRVKSHVKSVVDLGLVRLVAARKSGQGKVSKRVIRGQVTPEQDFAGELPADETFVEGAVRRVVVNQYERDPKARAACLKKRGYSCEVCEINFGEHYGKSGDGFIHVHHRKPLSLRKAEYKLNPVTDLVPVCPNCHAMLHYGRPWDSPLSTAELRKMMRKQAGGR